MRGSQRTLPKAIIGGTLAVIVAYVLVNADVLGSPRVFVALADDGLFFKALATVHPRFKTPHVATLLVFSRSFESLTETFVIAI